MPENTFIYDTVWEEYREEHDLSVDDMNEFISGKAIEMSLLT